MLRWRSAALLCFAFVIGLASAQEMPEGRLMRFPDSYKDRIAFSYAGDLWLVASSGGTARRITTHPGRELFPKFSPDGKWLAFTGQFDGNFNVYVMPAEGGQPKQLTYYQGGAPLSERMGINNEVVGWHPDGKHILFLSRRDATNGWAKRLFSVSVDGGLAEALPMDQGGLGSFSADGSKIAYNRIFRNFRTWKRYTGGMAQDITIYDLKNNTSEDLPHTEWTDTFPMWHGNTIYFTSDRGAEHRLNLYSYDLSSKQIRQLTNFTDFDVMWPSLGPDAIVFENAGYLYRFDIASQQASKLTVYLPGDFDQARPHWVSVSRNISDFDVSPEGKRAVFGARGDVFTVPTKEGSVRNLTRTPGIREKGVSWSPDGRWVAYVSDRSGEDELYITLQDGAGKEQQITSGHKGFMFPPQWSPDSRKLAWSDSELRLHYVDINERKPVEVDRGKFADLTEYAWSPDSKWIAYAKQAENNNSVIYLYSLADRKSTPVTTSFTDSTTPTFDPDGRYLYFVSNRDYNEVIGNYDFEFANPKTARVYIATLRADVASPLPVLSDEAPVKKEEPAPAATAKDRDVAKEKSKDKKEEEKPKDEKKEAAKEFRIELEGIQQRIVALPTAPAAAIRSLLANKDFIFYSTTPVQGLNGPLPGELPSIHSFDLKERKDKVFLEGSPVFALSADGSKLMYSGGGEGAPGNGGGGAGGGERTYGIVDAKAVDTPHKVGDGVLNLSSMRMLVDPRQEWKQMYNEVWRQERDFFFEASMNGVDWQKEGQKYAQLLPYVNDRYTLTYVMGELIGELSNSHTYVGGGDYPDLHAVNVGLLGAEYEVDKATGYYRIAKIYPGENWDNGLRSPLTEPGVNVKQGDYLLAINGRPVKAPQTPDELLVNTVGDTVALTVNSKPSDDGARTIQVRPIGNEYNLKELNWIESNRKKVEAATNGRVGYVYLPDMGANGLNQFVKQYFPQVRKEGMIFDVRYNGGGFVDQLIFARLRRTLAAMGSARHFEPGTVPAPLFYGAMACVTNHYAASDGDFFSYFFKVYKLGPLIGERTWGGVRGIRGQIPLMDGGYITRPEFSLYGLDSKWLIENKGVQPDIVVENRPEQVIKGQDPQLERAIEEVMKEIQRNPRKLPPPPPDLPAYPEGPGM